MVHSSEVARHKDLFDAGISNRSGDVSHCTKKSVSLVMCVYNESNLLPDAARRCAGALSSDFDDFEIIFVDDGSVDGTGEIIGRLAQGNAAR